MDLRSEKEVFIANLSLNVDDSKAVSLGIDCLIDNESSSVDTPIVLVDGDYMSQSSVRSKLEDFCNHVFPGREDWCRFRMLNVSGRTSDEASKNLINNMRLYGFGLLYYADSVHWLKGLPSGLFHVVSLRRSKVSRWLNQKEDAIEPKRITEDYRYDSLLDELFLSDKDASRQNIGNSNDAMNLFLAERNSGLIRAIPAPKGTAFDKRITIESPEWQKVACVALRGYQARECDDGMLMDTSASAWRGIVAYPLVEQLNDITGSEVHECMIGLVMMNIDDPKDPYLSTVWIHPFYRRKRKLTSLWPTLTSTYGDFPIDSPNSSMRAFLKHVEHNQGYD